MEIRAPDLVRAAMEATGATRPSDLAKALGLTGYASPKRVQRWRDGENEPDFDATIALLRLAGWLDESAMRRDRGEEGLAEAAAAQAETEEEARRRLEDRAARSPRRRRSA